MSFEIKAKKDLHQPEGEASSFQSPLLEQQGSQLGASAAPQAAPKAGSGQFTNLQSYLQASKGRGTQGIQTGITQQLQGQAQKAEQAQEKVSGVAKSIQDEKARVQQNLARFSAPVSAEAPGTILTTPTLSPSQTTLPRQLSDASQTDAKPPSNEEIQRRDEFRKQVAAGKDPRRFSGTQAALTSVDQPPQAITRDTLEANKDFLKDVLSGQARIDRDVIEQQAATNLGEMGQATQNIQQTGQMLGSETGRKQLISKLAQNPRYTTGQGMFDQLLMQADKGDVVSKLAAQQKALLDPKQQALQSYLEGDTSIAKQMGDIYGTDKQTGLLSQAQQAARTKLGDISTGLESELAKKAQQLTAQRSQEIGAVKSFLETGELPTGNDPASQAARKQIEDQLGLKEGSLTYGLFGGTTGEQLASQFGVNLTPLEVKAAQAASQGDVETFNLIKNLMPEYTQKISGVEKLGGVLEGSNKKAVGDLTKQYFQDILNKDISASRDWGSKKEMVSEQLGAQYGRGRVQDTAKNLFDKAASFLGTTDPSKVVQLLNDPTMLNKLAGQGLSSGEYVDSSRASNQQRAQYRANIDAFTQLRNLLSGSGATEKVNTGLLKAPGFVK